MPLPSYKKLKNENIALKKMVGELSEDPETGLTSRQAIPYELKKLTYPPGAIVMLFCLQEPAAIKKILHTRNAEIVLRARWDEYHYLFWIDYREENGVYELAKQIYRHSKKAHIPVGLASCRTSGNVESDVRTLLAIMQAREEGYNA